MKIHNEIELKSFEKQPIDFDDLSSIEAQIVYF
jgi:hypothetical protein